MTFYQTATHGSENVREGMLLGGLNLLFISHSISESRLKRREVCTLRLVLPMPMFCLEYRTEVQRSRMKESAL